MTCAPLALLTATILLGCGCNGAQTPAQTASERTMSEKTNQAETAHTEPDPPDAIRLRKGTNSRVGSHELGVIWIAEGTHASASPALEMKLSVFDRASGSDVERILRAGGTLTLGDAVYEVVRLEPRRGDAEAYGVIAPAAR
jgi:hypothetical protein